MKQTDHFETPGFEVMDNPWRIDKKVPVALILTVLVQSVVFAFWFGTLSNRVNTIEETIIARSNIPDRVTRIEERFRSMRDILKRIEKKLDRVTDRNGGNR